MVRHYFSEPKYVETLEEILETCRCSWQCLPYDSKSSVSNWPVRLHILGVRSWSCWLMWWWLRVIKGLGGSQDGLLVLGTTPAPLHHRHRHGVPRVARGPNHRHQLADRAVLLGWLSFTPTKSCGFTRRHTHIHSHTALWFHTRTATGGSWGYPNHYRCLFRRKTNKNWV